jgi:hypothetical protein
MTIHLFTVLKHVYLEKTLTAPEVQYLRFFSLALEASWCMKGCNGFFPEVGLAGRDSSL